MGQCPRPIESKDSRSAHAFIWDTEEDIWRPDLSSVVGRRLAICLAPTFFLVLFQISVEAWLRE
jgi:hypothetical protein